MMSIASKGKNLMAKHLKIRNTKYGKNQPLGLILGPCAIESKETTLEVASYLKKHLDYPFIFKASFDKANRSSVDTPRGVGIDEGLDILESIKAKLDLAVTTDIHLPEHVEKAKQVCDILQIPAFLARQTDLVVEAAGTGLPVNVKKGQFMAPQDMEHVARKIQSTGNDQIIFTERGTSFGYHNLVNDMRSFPIMNKFCTATCYDITHSGQLPGQGKISGGEKAFMEPLAMAAIAAGADMIFLETHPNPEKAISDSKTQLPLEAVPALIEKLYKMRQYVQKHASLDPACSVC